LNSGDYYGALGQANQRPQAALSFITIIERGRDETLKTHLRRQACNAERIAKIKSVELQFVGQAAIEPRG